MYSRERLTGRNTETPEEIEDRINAAKWELTKKDKYDYVVVNKIVEDASDEILSILNKKERLIMMIKPPITEMVEKTGSRYLLTIENR